MICTVCGRQEYLGFIPPAYHDVLCETCFRWSSTYFTKLVMFYADHYWALTKTGGK